MEIKLKGVSYDNRQEIINHCKIGQKVILIREDNMYDANAIAVLDENKIGYIPKEIAASLSSRMDSGEMLRRYITSIMGQEFIYLGVKICIYWFSPNKLTGDIRSFLARISNNLNIQIMEDGNENLMYTKS